jgi:CelD/BcsL family acetyltransferase involved in cellulose biosynthesis
VSISTQCESRLSARVLRRLADLQNIASDWSELFGICPEATPFQSPEWLLSWTEVFSRDLIAIEVREGNRLIGFAPLLMYPRESERVLAFAGGAVSDYLDLLAEPGRELQILEAVCLAMEAENGWTILDLTDLPSRSVLLRPQGFQQLVGAHDSCSALVLPNNRDDLLHLFSKHQRANLRNARSRLQRAGGGRLEIATPETLPEFLDDLFRLHTARWSKAGEPGVLHEEQIRAFHRFAAPRLLRRGVLRVYRLRLKSQTIAIIYSLFQNQTVFCYLQGFDPEFSCLSPATQLMFSVMQDAVGLGMRKFDFLRGQEPYKQHWRAHREPTYRIQLPRSALASTFPSRAEAA